MGTAILSGMLASGYPAEKVTITTKSQESALKLSDELGVNAISIESNSAANQDAVAGADVVLVAVKPAYVVEVLKEASAKLEANALVISVAAGITTASMEAAVPATVAVVRSMPNTPAIVARAVTGLAVGSRSTDEHLETIIRDRVALITLNRPEARNAVNRAVSYGVCEALDEMDRNPNLRAGILTGAGGNFCSGMDLKAFLRGEVTRVEGRGILGIARTPPKKPLIAAVEGYCLAGGFESMLCCDLVVMVTHGRGAFGEFLFGSQTNGRAYKDSDADFAAIVTLRPDTSPFALVKSPPVPVAMS